jgi:hypothetical protein
MIGGMSGRNRQRLRYSVALIAIDYAIWVIFPPSPWEYHVIAVVVAILNLEVVPWIVEKIVRARRYAELLRQRREACDN